ncbi:uncharacterized protein HD556DRAFT_1437972 [Suillus plorans]|uniref:Uncharacterized protein n=1 Tax=Suillus plorans TaxID=116603 RepID=A0A9P7J504_9AGAM|nr:uncharacterized protein HD556DRAFT_1437972 [Suillus plorans]KAG1802910.1 hypothetical protein HD556DRAFT_1437972 [Suillus plorans]
MEMGKVLTQVMMSHGGSVTILSLLILSAAAELQQHMNTPRTSLTGTPVWANIRGDDVCIQTYPLFPSTRNFRCSLPPSQGPSKPRKRPVVEEPEEHGKRAHAPSTRRWSRPAMLKRQHQKSRVVVSSDDGLDEEIPATPAISTTTKACRQYVEINTEEDIDEEANEEDAMELPRKSTAAVVALPIPSSPDLMEDEFANPLAEVWAPCCGQCITWDLICRQAYRKSQPFDFSSLPNPTDPPVHALAVSEVEEEQPPMVHPSNEELQDLQDEVAGLQATVEALQQQVINGDQQLQERYAAQEEHAKLLADELEGLRQLAISVTTHLTTETPPTNAHPEIQPSAEPSSVPPNDTSFQPATQPEGTSTEAHLALPNLPATPQAEVDCLPVIMKADEDVN